MRISSSYALVMGVRLWPPLAKNNAETESGTLNYNDPVPGPPDRSSEVRTYLLLSFLSNGYDIPFHTSKPNETLPYSMQLRFWIEYMRKKIRKDTLLMKKM